MDDVEAARLRTQSSPQFAYGTFVCPEEVADGADVPVARPVVYRVEASLLHELDDSLPYRRYLTYDELVFAWNAVLIFLIAMVVTMVIVTAVFAFLYTQGAFLVDKK